MWVHWSLTHHIWWGLPPTPFPSFSAPCHPSLFFSPSSLQLLSLFSILLPLLFLTPPLPPPSSLFHFLPNSLFLTCYPPLLPPLCQTYIGSILITVNPYEVYSIYGTDVVQQYEGQLIGKLPPWVNSGGGGDSCIHDFLFVFPSDTYLQ